MHKQYLLIKGKPEKLSIKEVDRRIFIKIQKDNDKPFVLRIPITQRDIIKIIKNNGYKILSQKEGTVLNKYNPINGHQVKVYGKDLLVEIKANTEEELFKESNIVREELKKKYGITSQDKCKWICFR